MRFSKAVIKYRIPILILTVILMIPSVIGMINTRVNYDMLTYLPSDMETVVGQNELLCFLLYDHTQFLCGCINDFQYQFIDIFRRFALVDVLVPSSHKTTDQQPVFKIVQEKVSSFFFHRLSTSCF